MSDTTWNGCWVQVLDTTKAGLLVHVVEGTPSKGDEQAGRTLELPQGVFWGLGLEGTAPAHTEQTLQTLPPARAVKGRQRVVRKFVRQTRQGTGPRSYGGWPQIVIFAQVEGVHIGVYTRDKMARKSPLYKAGEAGLPTATKKVMLQWGETADGEPHFWNILPPGVASQLRQAPGRRKVVRQGARQLEDEPPETTTIFETPLDGLCLFHALARVWNEMPPQETLQTGQGMKGNLLEKTRTPQGGQWRDRHLRKSSKRMDG